MLPVRQAWREHHLRGRTSPRGKRRQARRPGSAVHRVMTNSSRKCPQNADRLVKLPSRCADRHGAFRSADGHPQGRDRERYADDCSQCGNNAAVTRDLCAKNVLHLFTNWQRPSDGCCGCPSKGYKKSVWVTWDDAVVPEAEADLRRHSKKAAARCCQALHCHFRKPTFSPFSPSCPVSG